jgi:hypothetical protein
VKKLPFILILSVPSDVDRSEFEPDAIWSETPNGRLKVTQRVAKEGGYLVGATDTYRERLADDILADPERFAGLLPS